MTDEELLDLVKEFFYYADGSLYNRVNRSRAKKDCKASNLDTSNGYMRVTFKGKVYKEHRLIFLLHHGYLPEFIDHINGIRSDNRIENLRGATRLQNNSNRLKRSNNTSGFKGVHLHKATGKFQARIGVGGVRVSLGLFNTAEEAHEAYKKAAIEVHGEFANFGEVNE
jgi:hypothetical protein